MANGPSKILILIPPLRLGNFGSKKRSKESNLLISRLINIQSMILNNDLFWYSIMEKFWWPALYFLSGLVQCEQKLVWMWCGFKGASYNWSPPIHLVRDKKIEIRSRKHNAKSKGLILHMLICNIYLITLFIIFC